MLSHSHGCRLRRQPNCSLTCLDSLFNVLLGCRILAILIAKPLSLNCILRMARCCIVAVTDNSSWMPGAVNATNSATQLSGTWHMTDLGFKEISPVFSSYWFIPHPYVVTSNDSRDPYSEILDIV